MGFFFKGAELKTWAKQGTGCLQTVSCKKREGVTDGQTDRCETAQERWRRAWRRVKSKSRYKKNWEREEQG